MAGLLQKLFGDKKNSKDIAKERLQLVLIHDRASLSPGMVDDLRKDLIEVISKYMDFDEEGLDVQVESRDEIAMLEVNIPIAKVKRHYSSAQMN